MNSEERGSYDLRMPRVFVVVKFDSFGSTLAPARTHRPCRRQNDVGDPAMLENSRKTSRPVGISSIPVESNDNAIFFAR